MLPKKEELRKEKNAFPPLLWALSTAPSLPDHTGHKSDLGNNKNKGDLDDNNNKGNQNNDNNKSDLKTTTRVTRVSWTITKTITKLIFEFHCRCQEILCEY